MAKFNPSSLDDALSDLTDLGLDTSAKNAAGLHPALAAVKDGAPRSRFGRASSSKSVPTEPSPSMVAHRAPASPAQTTSPAPSSAATKPSGRPPRFAAPDPALLKSLAPFERSVPKPAVPVAPIVPTRPLPFTQEQEGVIVCDARVIKVKAFAGAGKSSTLRGFAERRPSGRFLYIAFNKDIKEEASTKFPSNVKCMTSHGMAYRKYGIPLQDKLYKRLTWKAVYEHARVKPPHASIARAYARILTSIIANFVASAAPAIGLEHLPQADLALVQKSEPERWPEARTMLVDAEQLWSAMINPNNREVGVSPDVYLKLMQLAMPNLPYDGILLDEAQDSNPALLSMVQHHVGLQVLVGDPHQAIYSFRKAVDAMTAAVADQTLELTGSFRFGPEIADFANSLLAMKGETSSIRGLGRDGWVGENALPPSARGQRRAFISRTNAALFEEAAERAAVNQKLYFSGGIESAGFHLLRDLTHLYHGQRELVQDSLLSTFRSFSDFKSAVEENDDHEWVSRCKLVERRHDTLLDRLAAIERNTVPDVRYAQQIFSTAHRSKGLEYDVVVLADDFVQAAASSGASGAEKWVPPGKIEETNILYVAASRAQQCLLLQPMQYQYWRTISPCLNPATSEAIRAGAMARFTPEIKSHFEKIALKRDQAEREDNMRATRESVRAHQQQEQAAAPSAQAPAAITAMDDPFDTPAPTQVSVPTVMPKSGRVRL